MAVSDEVTNRESKSQEALTRMRERELKQEAVSGEATNREDRKASYRYAGQIRTTRYIRVQMCIAYAFFIMDKIRRLNEDVAA